MKKLIFIVLVIVFFNTSYSQGKLYVFSERPTFDINQSNDCRIDDYRKRYNLSHATGEYLINADEIDITISFQEGYNDDPSNGCGGPCGQFAWQPRMESNPTLNFFDTFLIDYTGPNPITCAWDFVGEDNIIPIQFEAVFIPNMQLIPDGNICSPLFDKYNGNTYRMEGLGPNEIIWEYFNGSTWQQIPNYHTTFPLNKSVKEIFGDNYSNYFTGNLQLRYNIFQGTYTENFTVDIIECSPEFKGILTTAATCHGSIDGNAEVTMGTPSPGYKMRFFVVDANAQIGDPTVVWNTTDNLPPQSVTSNGDVQMTPLNDGSGDFIGSFANGIPVSVGSTDHPNGYKIIYQEYSEDGNGNVTVHSGEVTDVFEIDQPSEVQVAITNAIQPQCSGEKGEVTLTASGGQDFENSTYEYSVNGGAWQPSPSFTNLDQGQTYTFASRLVLAGGTCTSTNTIQQTIDQVTNTITINSNSGWLQQPSSPTATDGSLRIITNNGIPNYTYELFNAANDQKLDEITGPNASEDFTVLGVGSYYVVVTDGNGCSATSATILLEATPIPQLGTPVVNQILCFNDTNGSITIPVSGGVKPYIYEWTRNSVFYDSGTTSNDDITINNLDNGVYRVTVASDGVPLSNTVATVTVAVNLDNPAEVVITDTAGNDISCNGAGDGSITITASGGTSYEYTLELFPDPDDWFPLVGNTITDLTAGFYDITLRNENGCESNTITNILVDEPEALLVSEISSTDATTNGGSDGSLEISVTGGTPPYQYVWTKDGNPFTPSANSTDTNLVDLQAGSYQVTVTDDNGNGCSASLVQHIIINEPGPLNIDNLDGTDVLCKGESTGSITAEVTGTPPFNFVWERQGDPSFTAPNQASITNLPAGTYTLRLTDATSSPEVIQDVTLTEPIDDLIATAIPTDVSCFTGNDGSIQVTATGGTAPYQYSINDGFTFQNGDTFTNLPANTYEVLVLDANNCEFRVSAQVNEPQIITIAVDDVGNVTTAGGSDGFISISVTGGTGQLNYAWTGPNGYTNTVDEDITGLAAGDYNITVTDANNCFADLLFPITVSEPGPLEIISLDGTNVGCKGEATGSITANVTGTPPFNYTWEKQGDASFSAPNQQTIDNLAEGTYILRLTDASTNPEVTDTVTIAEPAEELNAVAIPTDATCFGGTSGTIQINATGGTPPYEYSLDNGASFQANNIFTDLAAANYNIVVRDANGCEIPVFAAVGQPQELVLVIDEQRSLSVAGATDGAISITVGGGTAPYTYEWFANNGFTSTDEDITDLAGGDYTVIVRDANWTNDADGCTLVQDFVIAEPGELTVNIDQTVLLECNGDDFAELTANVQGGVTPYSYEWFQIDNGNNINLNEDTEILGNLSAGEYLVRVTDANNITVDATSVIIDEPDLLEIIVDSTTDVLCSGDETGAIDISVIGGTAPYQYFWSNGETTEDLSNITAGDYTLEIVDTNGCLTEQLITISTPPDALQIANATVTDASEYEANDGSIALDITGGLLPYTINWVRLSDNSNVGNQESISGLSADSYEVSVSDANGCTIMETYQITQPDIVVENITQPTCAGDSDGSIEVIVNNGNGNFTYAWSTGAVTNIITGLGPGSYMVTITGFGDGPLTRTYVIEDTLPLVVDLGEDRVLCEAQELVLDASVEDETATYEWTSDNGFSSSEPSVTITQSGNYSVTVITQSGCTAQGSISVDVTTDEISAEFAVSSQAFVDEVVVAVDISYPLPETLEWILPDAATVIKKDNDEVELVFSEAGEYEIGIITTMGACIATQTKTVLILDKDGSITEDNKEDIKKRIDDFILYPNPTDGKFTAEVNLGERANISLKVFSFANNALMASAKERGQTAYSVPFDLSALPSGVYAVLLETPYGNRLQKVIVK